MSIAGSDNLEQLDRHLASPSLTWLLGAGISYTANIPLMASLTTRVLSMVSGSKYETLIEDIRQELPIGSHIEHLLSHLGDYAAIADRSKVNSVTINGNTVEGSDIISAHDLILSSVSNTVRWGYKEPTATAPETIGSYQTPIITVDDHQAFVSVLFGTSQAGLRERRQAVRLFTTNYDTLLEDALALCCIDYWDGFSGGAVAFRTHRFGQDAPTDKWRAIIVKLHGSIDWHLGDEGKVWRIRDGDKYPPSRGRVLIYPQSTKYAATQRDPFASQFDLFRRTLGYGVDNTFAVCGYSFGDDHINQEIELALSHPDNRTTLIAFVKANPALPACLAEWRTRSWANRVYIVADTGLYVGAEGPLFPPPAGKSHDWWTFTGAAKLLRDGAEACI